MDRRTVDWIAVDWGTTNLRAWAMAGDEPVASIASPAGMGTLAREGFEPALLEVVEPWLSGGSPTPVVACGMVGARQGWVEVPYAPVPGAPLQPDRFRSVETADPRIRVTIVHGLAQAEPADVMRGEETQVAGLLATGDASDLAVCLPGTHTKWVRLEGGTVRAFRTCMTGELFALLRGQSILRHSTGTAETIDAAAYRQGVRQSLDDPSGIAAHLFGIRAAGLLSTVEEGAALGRLSGLLIGLEVGAAAKAHRAGEEVVVIGQDRLAGLYAEALEMTGLGARRLDAEGLTLAGLRQARRLMENGR